MDGTTRGEWKQAVNNRRVYYYNAKGESKWPHELPVEFMSPIERALVSTSWTLCRNDDGRDYYFNTESKETAWDLPPEIKEKVAPQALLPPRPAALSFASTGPAEPFRSRDRERDRDRDDYRHVDRAERLAAYNSAQNEYEYASPEEAEAAFFKALRRVGALKDWTWEQAMRATVKEPEYRAIKEPRDRRAAFEKFVAQIKAEELAKEQDRQARVRADFITMLKRHPEIHHYTRWKSARPILETETIFRSTPNEDERIKLFNEYRTGLYKEWLESEAANRREGKGSLGEILASLDLQPYTGWETAHRAILSNKAFQSAPKFQSLYEVDIFTAFESHIKQLQIAFNQKVQREKRLKVRQRRRNRDEYKQLLQELRGTRKIKAGTKWSQIQPLIEDDKRYIAMLGQPGSTPLELFWDVMEQEDLVFKEIRATVEDVLQKEQFEIRPSTTLDEFLSVMSTDPRTAHVDQDVLATTFDRIMRKVKSSKAIRGGIDALRSVIKHLDPPVSLTDSWDQVRSRVQNTDAYHALETEDLARAAYDKHMRRKTEKEKGREDSRRRDKHGDREWDRDHRSSRRHRRTRSPEVDPYEADRRKAQADRERHWERRERKPSIAGLSPPPVSRREREVDRYEPPSRHESTYYDRERRGGADRERRSYIDRADPRDRGSELDYGDGGGTSVGGIRANGYRRRRDSDGDSVRSLRDSKRQRRSKTPVIPKEDPGLKSGSEEGEIEET